MVICFCQGLREKELQERLRRQPGAKEAVIRGCQSGRSCGACIKKIEAISIEINKKEN